MNLTKLLELRKKQKSKKPHFVRQGYGLKIRLKDTWRKPKGAHSKIREKRKGHRKPISIGYRSPVEVRYLTPSGLKPWLVTNLNQLKKAEKNVEIILSKGLGLKKKMELLKEIQKLGLKVLNIKNIEQFIKKSEESLSQRKSKKAEKTKEKEQKKKEKEKTAEEKKKKEETSKKEEQSKDITQKVEEEEERKKKEKEEKDRLLTKKE